MNQITGPTGAIGATDGIGAASATRASDAADELDATGDAAGPAHGAPRIDFRASEFKPASWLRHGHLQTIAGELWPRRLGAVHEPWRRVCERVELALPDGDRVVAYFHFHPDDPDHQRPVVLHLHGLEGSAEASYQRGLSAKTYAAGFHSVRLNYRNCGGHESLASGVYSGRSTDDVLAVLDLLRTRWNFEKVMLTGVSLGGNMLLRLLADARDQVPAGVIGAVAVSSPIEMTMTAAALSQGLNKGYEIFFLALLKQKLRRKVRLSPNGDKYLPYVRLFGRIWTLRAWDELVTGPLAGFAGADEYYASASSGPDLGCIRVPTLLLHAQDDPFIPFAMYEKRQAEIGGNPWLYSDYPRRGGHVGFWAASGEPRPEPWMDERWSENEAVRFLAAVAK